MNKEQIKEILYDYPDKTIGAIKLDKIAHYLEQKLPPYILGEIDKATENWTDINPRIYEALKEERDELLNANHKWRVDYENNHNKWYERYVKETEALKAENAELKLKLKTAIIPKFKIGQEVWFIRRLYNDVSFGTIIRIVRDQKHSDIYYYELDFDGWDLCYEYELYATQEEAEKALEELKNE